MCIRDSDFLGELVGLVSLPSQRLHDYAMMKHKDGPVRYLSHVPYAVLTEERAPARALPFPRGVSHLSAKVDRYATTQGHLSLADYDARAAAFRPRQMEERYRFLCDTSVKHGMAPDDVAALYRLEQEHSRTLRGKGPGLSRADVESLREKSP